VHNKAGQPVRDLTAADFRIFEDGKEQKIAMFALNAEPLAAEAQPGAPVASDAAPLFTNRLPERVTGGVTVILFDRLNSTLEEQKPARDQILKLLARAAPGDRVALYVLESDAVTVLHDFTTDTRRLVAVLNKHLGNTSVEMVRSTEEVPSFMPVGLAADDAETEAWLERTTLMVGEFYLRRRAELTTSALEGIANHLAGVPGHKSLVWVSSGFPLVVPTDHGPQVLNREVNRATRAINNADVAVYPVDIRGLVGAFVNPATASASYGPGIKPSQPFTTLATTHPVQDTMRTIADATGGRVFVNSNAIGEAVRRAMDDSRVSYLLGYYAPGSSPDNKFHKIEVKVNRGGLDVRHRKGYLALPPPARLDAKTRLNALMRIAQSPIESSAFALQAQVERTPTGERTVVVRVDPAAVTWTENKGVREGAIDVLIMQSVPGGTYYKIKEMTVDLAADAERYQQMLTEGLTLSSTFAPRPDAYRLHVVIADAVSHSAGSLIIPIEK
jgi:VWFA-related protein